jgi:hypothetical protein
MDIAGSPNEHYDEFLRFRAQINEEQELREVRAPPIVCLLCRCPVGARNHPSVGRVRPRRRVCNVWAQREF